MRRARATECLSTAPSRTPLHRGDHLARRDVVVITINYRVGVFGFLAHPDLTREDPRRTSGNYGLWDIVEALRQAQTMGDYWTNFARSGNPNSRRLPNWPRYVPERTGLVMHFTGTPGARPLSDIRGLKVLDEFFASLRQRLL